MDYKRTVITLFKQCIVEGYLVIEVDGETHCFGDELNEPSVVLQVHDGENMFKQILTDGNLGFAEGYRNE